MPKYICPHCAQSQVSLLQKLWSGSASPATCGSCGCLSFVRTHWQLNLVVLAGYCVALAALAAFFSLGGHLGFLALAVAACVSGYGVSLHKEPLQPTSSQAVTSTRPFTLAVVAVFMLLVGIAAYLR